MRLLSVDELSHELSIPRETLIEMIDRRIIVPYGGRARLGEPRFSMKTLPAIRRKVFDDVQ